MLPVLREVLQEVLGEQADLPPPEVKAVIYSLGQPCSQRKDGFTLAKSTRRRRQASVRWQTNTSKPGYM